MTEGTPPTPDQPGPSGQQPQPPGQQPPPYGQSFGDQPSYQQPGYGQPVPGQPAPGQYGEPAAYPETPRDPDRRPGTVLAAAIITWVFAGLAVVGAAIMMLAVGADRDAVVDELEQDEGFRELDWSADEFIDALTLFSIVTIVLSLIAIVLALLAFRRSNGGRMALVVLSGLTGLLTLAGSIFCIPALWLLASVTAIVLLFTGGANDWYARRTPGQPAHPQPGDYGQWPQA